MALFPGCGMPGKACVLEEMPLRKDSPAGGPWKAGASERNSHTVETPPTPNGMDSGDFLVPYMILGRSDVKKQR